MDGHAPLGISKDRIARLISDRLTFGQHPTPRDRNDQARPQFEHSDGGRCAPIGWQPFQATANCGYSGLVPSWCQPSEDVQFAADFET
jgi:hypothetical protein